MEGIAELGRNMQNTFWGIGFFGWQLSAIYALYISFKFSWSCIFVFFVSFLCSGWLNRMILKQVIYDPRPSNSIAFLKSESFNKKSNGMPSGHAQQSALALTFAYIITGKRFYESLILFFMTVLQRYAFHNHTFLQLLVGSIVGVFLGYFTGYGYLQLLEWYQQQKQKEQEKKQEQKQDQDPESKFKLPSMPSNLSMYANSK